LPADLGTIPLVIETSTLMVWRNHFKTSGANHWGFTGVWDWRSSHL